MQSEYKTKDLAEASFFLAKAIPLKRLERDGRICWFIFVDGVKCKRLSEDFWFGQATIQAKGYYDAMQTLKNRIFS